MTGAAVRRLPGGRRMAAAQARHLETGQMPPQEQTACIRICRTADLGRENAPLTGRRGASRLGEMPRIRHQVVQEVPLEAPGTARQAVQEAPLEVL